MIRRGKLLDCEACHEDGVQIIPEGGYHPDTSPAVGAGVFLRDALLGSVLGLNSINAF
jgi:cytochrome c5